MADIGIGFLGCGLIARSHARGLAAVADAAVVAAFDIDPARADAFAADHAGTRGTAMRSAEAVIDASDAVYVCTWTAAHPELVAAVAAAGKPVFCEKPLAVDYPTARSMRDVVETAGVTNQVGLVLRNSPAFRWLRHQVLDPAVGQLMNVVFRDDQYLPTQGMYGSTWRGDRTKAGAGTLLEHSIHDLDLLRWIMGPIESVSASMGNVHGLDGIDDQSSVLLVARSGAQATLTSVWHDVLSRPSQRRVEVFCRDAVLTVSGDWSGPVSIETSTCERTHERDGLTEVAAAADGLGVNPDAAFVESIVHGKPAYPDFALALDAHRLADAAYLSAASGGQPVDL